MAFGTAYFVLTTKHSDFDSKNRPRLERWRHWWNIMDKRSVGDVFVFEREDACRKLYALRVEQCISFGSETSIRYVRALTQKRAAEAGFRGEGEVLEYHRPTYEEAQELTRRAEEDDLRRYREDIEKFRAVIERAHARFPNIDRSEIPAVDDQYPRREKVYVEHYVAALFQCGAVPDAEIEDLAKTLKTGHGNLRYWHDAPVIKMVPNS
ncbi:hypothetical protein BCL32_1014 [Rhizobium mongolense USDA 1844]|uniref:Uncharacterized protein n=2 Tax=Rhizobium mongolense TaxID=57676 RepID=A0A559TDY8_9HYPH|nr:hypothetical protein BCL32_1014 [Rhizobium mongolense USDA 1844]